MGTQQLPPSQKSRSLLAGIFILALSPLSSAETFDFGSMSFESTRKSTTGSTFCLTDLLANEAGGRATNFTINTSTRRVSYDTPDEDISYKADSMKTYNLPGGPFVKYDYFFEGTNIDYDMPAGIDRAEWSEFIAIDFNSYTASGELVQDEVFTYKIYYNTGSTETCSVAFQVVGTLDENPRRYTGGDERTYLEGTVENIGRAIKAYKGQKSRNVERAAYIDGVRG